ncbi:hypothetical protein RhiirC2_768971 [Rhizophagus irregularis]|uniref:Uncharacterized protein n=1 Tax=Rhizophagus irregularis TaxID=588596 RepID=A0A2N1P0E4_9GLOM|nr:hypothetical protein RhiirC2_768971 [Rhizophagus irregularis]
MLYIYYSTGLKLKEIIGYGFKLFKDFLGKNSEEWLRDFQKNVIVNQINFAPDADEVADKNWKCINFSDNLKVANLNTIWTLGAGNAGNQIDGLNNTAEIGKVGVEIATGANLIYTCTFNENWSIAGKRLTVNVSVALNAGEELFTVTITPVFGQLAQESMLIEQFVNHIKKIGKIAKMTSEHIQKKYYKNSSRNRKIYITQADTLSSFLIAQPSIIQPGHYTDADIEKLRGKKTLTKKSDFGKKKADQIHSDCFFEEVIKNMDDDSNKNDDPVKKMCKP